MLELEKTDPHFWNHSSLHSDPSSHPDHHLDNYRSSKRPCLSQVTSHFSGPRKRTNRSQGVSSSAGLVLSPLMMGLHQTQEAGVAKAEREEEVVLPLLHSARRAGLRVTTTTRPCGIARGRFTTEALTEIESAQAFLGCVHAQISGSELIGCEPIFVVRGPPQTRVQQKVVIGRYKGRIIRKR